ncbi:hypothetical protein N7486_003230 [Penicillium sp. IBT 16267x]|nr:hypothetical protein N7486_003230 [Penicillium sp. IBT 16267x]
MGFHKTSMNIELKNGHVLTAYCRRPSGDAIYSELDLDDFLGTKRGKHSKAEAATALQGQNIAPHPHSRRFDLVTNGVFLEGKFAWSAEGFSDQASDVILKLEGATLEPMLHASLDDDEGGHHMDVVNLADCIKNENGRLRYMDCF